MQGTETGRGAAALSAPIDRELLEDFIAECREHIQQIEVALLALETDPDDLEASLALLQDLLESERDACELDKRYLRKDGTLIWVHITLTLVRTP